MAGKGRYVRDPPLLSGLYQLELCSLACWGLGEVADGTTPSVSSQSEDLQLGRNVKDHCSKWETLEEESSS